MGKKWKDMDIVERLEAFQKMQAEILRETKEEEEKQKKKRAQLLQLKDGEETAMRRYEFDFPLNINLKNDDENKVKMILEEIGKSKYGSKTEPFNIIETDRDIRNFDGKWYYLELRWPRHYAGYVDSITVTRDWHCVDIYKPVKINILFIRGRREISSSTRRKALDEQANQIYEEIKTGIEKIPYRKTDITPPYLRILN